MNQEQRWERVLSDGVLVWRHFVRVIDDSCENVMREYEDGGLTRESPSGCVVVKEEIEK
jgi:hypothetical protein